MLAPKLSVEVELLTIRTRGELIRVCVTARCRCRLLSKPPLFVLIGVLKFRGPPCMNLLVRVTLSVV